VRYGHKVFEHARHGVCSTIRNQFRVKNVVFRVYTQDELIIIVIIVYLNNVNIHVLVRIRSVGYNAVRYCAFIIRPCRNYVYTCHVR